MEQQHFEKNHLINPQKRINQMLDEQFVKIMMEINERYGQFTKHSRIRIEQWSKKLCQITSNHLWKKNRNMHAIMLLNMVLVEKLDKPFSSIPPQAPLPSLSIYSLKAKLSSKFYKQNFNFKSLPEYQLPGTFPTYKQVTKLHERNLSKDRSRPQQGLIKLLNIKKDDSFDFKDNRHNKKHSFNATISYKNQHFSKNKSSTKNLIQSSSMLNQSDGNIFKRNQSLNQSNHSNKNFDIISDKENIHLNRIVQDKGGCNECNPIKEKCNNLQQQNVRLKTQVQVLNITLNHLKSELQNKTNSSTKQAIEIAELRRELAESRLHARKLEIGKTTLMSIPPLALPVRSLKSSEVKERLIVDDGEPVDDEFQNLCMREKQKIAMVPLHRQQQFYSSPVAATPQVNTNNRQNLIEQEIYYIQKQLLRRQTELLINRSTKNLPSSLNNLTQKRQNLNQQMHKDLTYSTNQLISQALRSIDDFDSKFLQTYSNTANNI